MQRMSEAPAEACPRCGGRVARKIGAGAGVIFKGSGFYITDYRSREYKAKEKAEKGSASGEGGDSGGKKGSASGDGAHSEAKKGSAPQGDGGGKAAGSAAGKSGKSAEPPKKAAGETGGA
jgi:predicted nucleic acid-binding Zn ribbon protein